MSSPDVTGSGNDDASRTAAVLVQKCDVTHS